MTCHYLREHMACQLDDTLNTWTMSAAWGGSCDHHNHYKSTSQYFRHICWCWNSSAASYDRTSYDVFWRRWSASSKIQHSYTDEKQHMAEGRNSGLHLCLLNGKKTSGNPWVEVLCLGWSDFQTLGISLVIFPIFILALIFGEHQVSCDMLLYLGQSDRDVITRALKEDLSDEDGDEILDLMDPLDVSRIPTQ